MAEQRVRKYQASWHVSRRHGVVELHLDGGEIKQFNLASVEEFRLMLVFLQHDSDPVLVDGEWISTGVERPGNLENG